MINSEGSVPLNNNLRLLPLQGAVSPIRSKSRCICTKVECEARDSGIDVTCENSVDKEVDNLSPKIENDFSLKTDDHEGDSFLDAVDKLFEWLEDKQWAVQYYLDCYNKVNIALRNKTKESAVEEIRTESAFKDLQIIEFIEEIKGEYIKCADHQPDEEKEQVYSKETHDASGANPNSSQLSLVPGMKIQSAASPPERALFSGTITFVWPLDKHAKEFGATVGHIFSSSDSRGCTAAFPSGEIIKIAHCVKVLENADWKNCKCTADIAFLNMCKNVDVHNKSKDGMTLRLKQTPFSVKTDQKMCILSNEEMKKYIVTCHKFRDKDRALSNVMILGLDPEASLEASIKEGSCGALVCNRNRTEGSIMEVSGFVIGRFNGDAVANCLRDVFKNVRENPEYRSILFSDVPSSRSPDKIDFSGQL